jgi:hypothetical protein
MKILTKNSDKIMGVETESNTYYLRNPRPISEIPKFLDLIQEFERHFDTSLIDTHVVEEEGEWPNVQEVKEFLEEKYKKTHAYFRVLAEKGEWISSGELRKEMEKLGFTKLVPQSLSGIRAGNTKSYRNWEKEPLDETEWNDGEWQNYYRIKPKYVESVRQALKEQSSEVE